METIQMYQERDGNTEIIDDFSPVIYDRRMAIKFIIIKLTAREEEKYNNIDISEKELYIQMKAKELFNNY